MKVAALLALVGSVMRRSSRFILIHWEKYLQRNYGRIDNSIYNVEKDLWWQPDSALYLLKTSMNPVRVGYFEKKLFNDLKIAPQGSTALEVGCGGGILCEEIARMGFDVTGIDPSAQ